jgi:hypothetical protein
MSVWPHFASGDSPLCGSEGALVSVSVTVAPRDLEAALDALAQLNFPINPQIYHDAVSIYRYADGRQERVPTTMVEFPAYENRLAEIRHMLESRRFDPANVHVAEMLEDIHHDSWLEPAPPGAPYESCLRRKYAGPLTAIA